MTYSYTSCLDVAGNSGTRGASVQQWDDIGSSAQRWMLTLISASTPARNAAAATTAAGAEAQPSNEAARALYPNPARTAATLEYRSTTSSAARCTRKNNLVPGRNFIPVDVTGLPTGKHVVRLRSVK